MRGLRFLNFTFLVVAACGMLEKSTAPTWSTPKKTPLAAVPASSTKNFRIVRGGAEAGSIRTSQQQALPPFLRLSYVVKVLAFAIGPMAARFILLTPDEPPSKEVLAFAAAWALNNLCVAVPGRYDGIVDASPVTKDTANLFTPQGWAFIIWAPIFIGEFFSMLYFTLDASSSATELAAKAAPWWVAAALAQCGWCATFRPSLGPKLLWVPTLLLGATAGLLGKSHQAILDFATTSTTAAAVNGGGDTSAIGGGTGYPFGGLTLLQQAVVRVPITLHFAWITCATLVNLNKWLALNGNAVSLGVRTAAAFGSVGAALALAAYVAVTTKDPLFPAVVAWALAAVAADGSSRARGVVSKKLLGALKATYTAGAAVAAALSAGTAFYIWAKKVGFYVEF